MNEAGACDWYNGKDSCQSCTGLTTQNISVDNYLELFHGSTNYSCEAPPDGCKDYLIQFLCGYICVSATCLLSSLSSFPLLLSSILSSFPSFFFFFVIFYISFSPLYLIFIRSYCSPLFVQMVPAESSEDSGEEIEEPQNTVCQYFSDRMWEVLSLI